MAINLSLSPELNFPVLRNGRNSKKEISNLKKATKTGSQPVNSDFIKPKEKDQIMEALIR